MSLSAAERFFSLLALIAGGGAIALVGLTVVPSGRPVLARVGEVAPWLAWLVTATSMFGSLYFSESQHFEPCKLCWYQRIAMYPLVPLLVVGLVTGERAVRRFALALAGFCFIIAMVSLCPPRRGRVGSDDEEELVSAGAS